MAAKDPQRSIHPVVLCGGIGARLWPLSRTGRSKAFLDLIDGAGFDATLERARRWSDSGRVIVSANVSEAAEISGRLAGVPDVTVLLEPEGRNTAAAIAAAALLVARDAPEGVLVAAPSDHLFDDQAELDRAVATACAAEALVVLGAAPDHAATAYGYIVPGATVKRGGLSPVRRFVEKPFAGVAQSLIDEGALWNCGLVIAPVKVLLAAFAQWAPEVLAAARDALEGARDQAGAIHLADSFRSAPALPFDRAVLEKTDAAWVLPIRAGWRDVGSWAALADALAKDADGNATSGDVTLDDAQGVLAHADEGVRLVVRGTSSTAVVATADGVVVTSLEPQGPSSGQDRLGAWLRTAALPLWATLGWDEEAGVFREALSQGGIPVEPRRRSRVQARQVFVYASAALDDPGAPWGRLARRAMETLMRRGGGADGLYAYAPDLGAPETDPQALLYDQAFVLLALAALARLEPDAAAWPAEAERLRNALGAYRHAAGGFAERAEDPFQSNALMHLFEAAIAWTGVTGGREWTRLGAELADLALDRLIDPQTGAMGEVFDATWGRPEPREARLEPGHQFEWAWLLMSWGDLAGDLRCAPAARRLYDCGRRGVAPEGAVVDALTGAFDVSDAAGRLWPHCEHLRAARVLGSGDDATRAARALAAFLRTATPGLWHERRDPNGRWLEGPSPATSLYHLWGAVKG